MTLKRMIDFRVVGRPAADSVPPTITTLKLFDHIDVYKRGRAISCSTETTDRPALSARMSRALRSSRASQLVSRH